MVILPALMIGGALGTAAFCLARLRLPDTGDLGAYRRSLSPLEKFGIAYMKWVGRGVLDLVAIVHKAFAQRIEKSADRLAQLADRPWSVTGAEVVGATAMLPVVAAIVLVFYFHAFAPKKLVGGVVFGTCFAAMLPWLYLTDLRKERSRRMLKAFPNALDLLTLCVEAGMDFTEGMKMLANRCAGMPAATARKRLDYGICKLFSELLSDIQMGVPRAQALRRLAEKTDLLEIRSFATVLSLSDETGGNIGANLRQLASDMRTTRVMRAEEFIAKAPVKMLFPTALFLFPVVFLIVFGPIGLSMLNSMRNL
jgi:tight adherence protein C